MTDLRPENETESKKLLQSELIDKFIMANPRIEPVRDTSKQSCRRYFKAFY